MLRSETLLGPARRGRPTRIMVTMPTEAVTDPDLVREMLVAGMDCMRINCAHDTDGAVESDAREPARGREADPSAGLSRG